jgi:hypothetical protein
MSKLTKVILYSVGAWIVALALIYILPVPFISGFGGLLSLLVGFALLIVALTSLVVDKDKVTSLFSILLVATTTWLALTKSFDWGARVHFRVNRGAYEEKLSKVLSLSSKAEVEKLCGDECWVMDGDAKRVAFHYVHGFLNWHDFVYDPTGAVTERDYVKRKQVDTYLVEAEHLTGNWYLVYFGD